MRIFYFLVTLILARILYLIISNRYIRNNRISSVYSLLALKPNYFDYNDDAIYYVISLEGVSKDLFTTFYFIIAELCRRTDLLESKTYGFRLNVIYNASAIEHHCFDMKGDFHSFKQLLFYSLNNKKFNLKKVYCVIITIVEIDKTS